MDPEVPEAMMALAEKYGSDPAQRSQIRASVEAKVPPERAALLLQLLDSISTVAKDPIGTDTP